jgi:hypothetical protein
VRRRYGRMHRLFLLSSNKVKGSILTPIYYQDFRIEVLADSILKIPADDTIDITALLDDIKDKVSNQRRHKGSHAYRSSITGDGTSLRGKNLLMFASPNGCKSLSELPRERLNGSLK